MSLTFGKAYESIERGIIKVESHGIGLVRGEKLSACALHGVTMRFGGISRAPFDTLNMSFNRPEPGENVRENYRRLSEAAGFAYDSMVLTNYCHGDNVVEVCLEDAGKGFARPPLPHCDALATRQKGLTLVTLCADCLPVLLCDIEGGVAGICHAGWKGTSLEVGSALVAKMEKIGARAERIVGMIGPSICRNCFEVEEDVRTVFESRFPGLECARDVGGGKFRVDLWMVMAYQLREAGMRMENLTLSGECTYERPDSYFSYRRDAKRLGGTGAMAAFIQLRPR